MSSETQSLEVTYRKIADLIPYERNARTHSKAQIRKIRKSIRHFGFVNPVLIDANDRIIAGHARVAAAKLLGLEEVPTIRLDMLTPAQVRAYVLADNRLAEEADWDQQVLKIELQNLLLQTDCDITDTGFEMAEIDLVIGEKEADDPADLLPVGGLPVVTRLGDGWRLGKHCVVCDDMRKTEVMVALMQGRQADMVFSDPPFNCAIEGNVSGKGDVKHENFVMAAGEMSVSEFTAFLEDSFRSLSQFSTPEAVQFICMDWRHMGEMIAVGSKVYDSLLNLCVWSKNNGGQGSFYRSAHELIFVFRNGKGRHRNNIQLGKFGRYRTNVWSYPAVRGLKQQHGDEGNLLALHPTVKPVNLVADAILDCSARGDLILDGFLGSGSTLIAAERVGRICYGLDIDPKYVDVAIRRWQQWSGEKAIHAQTGRTFDEMAAEGVNHV